MISCAKIYDGSTYLNHHLIHNDYYFKNGIMEGCWEGKGSVLLGLAGTGISKGDKIFESFRKNRLPDGKKLTPNEREDSVRFLDFQCSAQKSVSVMAMALGDSRLIEAHKAAASCAYAELETFAACKVGSKKSRTTLTTKTLIAARFEHSASRALDPQLHTHFVTVNATYDAQSRRYYALNEMQMFQAFRYAGKVYQNELAKACILLGYDIREIYDEHGRIKGFEIAGVPDAMLKRFSKRREQIEKEIEKFLKEKGREPTTAEIHIMTTQTRDRKLKEISTPEVIAAQRAQLTEKELAHLEAIKAKAIARAAHATISREPYLEKYALHHAAAHIFERECVAKGHDLLAEALNQKLGKIDLPLLHEALMNDNMERLTVTDTTALRDRYTSREEMFREKWILTVAGAEHGEHPALADTSFISPKLSAEQADAVRHLLECRDRFAVLEGSAGVGKSTLLTEASRLLSANDRHIAVFAPTASATSNLRKEGFEHAETVAALLSAKENSPVKRDSVLIVDEAGMLSNIDGHEIMRLALKYDCRVIFVGDARQHTSVAAGDFLRLLQSTSGLHRAELKVIRRQTCAKYRHAISLMAGGHVREGLRALNDLGRIDNASSNYLSNAAKEYLESSRTAQNTGEILCVAPTWEEIDALNASIRTLLKEEGRISNCTNFTVHESLGWTNAEKSDPHRYRPGTTVCFNRKCGVFRMGESATVLSSEDGKVRVLTANGRNLSLPLEKGAHDVCVAKPIEIGEGDMIQLRANERARKLVNGTLLKITAIKDDVIHTKEGLRINTREYSRFSHGYATTSHKSQGLTCEHIIVAAARLDAKAAYVACSRGKTLCTVHTPDFEHLLKSLPAGDRPLATEFAPAPTNDEQDFAPAICALGGPQMSSVFISHPDYQQLNNEQPLQHER